MDNGPGNGTLIKLLSSAYDLKVNVCDLNTKNLPYKDEYFDLISMTEVVEHIENPRKTISEISRVLRSGGIAIISTPNI